MDRVRTDECQTNLLLLFVFCLSALEYTSADAGRQSYCTGRCDGADSEADSLGLEEDEEPPVKDSRIVACAGFLTALATSLESFHLHLHLGS